MQDISTCEYQQMLKGNKGQCHEMDILLKGLMVFNAFERRFTTLYNYEFFIRRWNYLLILKMLTETPSLWLVDVL